MTITTEHNWRTYVVEPLQTVVFRSGFPFGSGVRTDGSNWPLPSAAAGLLCTQWERARSAHALPDYAAAARHVAQKGPWLLRWADEAATPVWCVPKPADALYMGGSAAAVVEAVALLPQPCPDGGGCDLPTAPATAAGDGVDRPGTLLPVMLPPNHKGKPRPGPAWWTFEEWLRWRCGEVLHWHGSAAADLPREARTHVSIDDASGAARDGQLFRTDGWGVGASLSGAPSRWGFVLLSNEDVPSSSVRFGGEGRLSALQALAQPPHGLDGPPEPLRQRARGASGLSLTLTTPAIFAHGWWPGWLDRSGVGSPPGTPRIRLRLRAAAIERWLPVSGWDLALQTPKAMRKAVAAGAVYWFDLIEPTDAVQALHDLWLASVSDREDDRRQGFGVVLPAPWSPPSSVPQDPL